MMFLVSCKTTKEIQIKYYVPEINPPEFPKLPDYEITEKGILVKDENYFRQLLIFKESYKSEINKYNEIKMKLEENNNE